MKKLIVILLSFTVLITVCACAETHIHQYGEWKITKQSTCSTEGIKERYCECGEKQTKTVEKKNHLPGKWTIDKENGTRTEVCAVCGEVMAVEAITYDGTTKLLYDVNPDDITCTVTGYDSIASPELVIPETLDGYTVTKIGDLAFFDCQLIEQAVLPDTVTALGASSFYECTSLKEINLPEGLTTVGSYEFYNCRSLKAITLPSTLAKLPKLAFGGCTSLESLNFSNGLVSIGNSAFFNCINIDEVILPETVTSLSVAVFKNCSGLKKVTFLGTLDSIGERVFSFCENLEEINMNGYNKYYVRGNCLVEVETQKLIAGSKNAEIPVNVKIIGAGAFQGITGIESLTLPNNVNTIEHDAFGKCYDLKEIILPASVKQLDGYVFYKDSNLKTVIYNGNMSDWDKINKNSVFDLGTDEYVIKCLDGDIQKQK